MTIIDPRCHLLGLESQVESKSDPRARILVCEDEIFIAMAEVELLERHGYAVVATAETCADAVERCAHHTPDLVLMDVTLRGEGDGVDAAAEIWERFRIPFVFVTAHQSDRAAQRALATEPAGYVFKPYDESELLTAVDDALATA